MNFYRNGFLLFFQKNTQETADENFVEKRSWKERIEDAPTVSNFKKRNEIVFFDRWND